VGLIGVYGGTFNPIHVGHLRAAEEVAEALCLERVLFVPSATPPHKVDDQGDAIAPAADRLAWVRLAIAGNPRFEASAIEVERGGASYLVDTLRELRANQRGVPASEARDRGRLVRRVPGADPRGACGRRPLSGRRAHP